jgi:hypothetical protein
MYVKTAGYDECKWEQQYQMKRTRVDGIPFYLVSSQ